MKTSKFIHGTRLTERLYARSFIKTCRNVYSYMLPDCTGIKDTLAFTPKNKDLLNQLGKLMGIDQSGDPRKESDIPAGYTYLGQFIDHDITLEPFSKTDEVNPKTKRLIPQVPHKTMNLRTPCLDLDSLYGGGPAVNRYLYDHTPEGMGIKFLLGNNNTSTGNGGPLKTDGSRGIPQNFDLPRTSDGTAIIGDPRNDENLFVSQLHHSMLKFHNAVVDDILLKSPGLSKDRIFELAQEKVRHHYQWIVVHDFLKRIIPPAVFKDVFINKNLILFKRKKGDRRPFALPVEFTIGAYRFGHSMVRDKYDFNFNFLDNTFINAFNFVARGRLPVFSNWAVDFNRFFDTGIFSQIKPQMAMKIDTDMALNLSHLPSGLNEFSQPGGMPNFKAILASRNLVRGLAFKLPSGQCVAKKCKMKAMTAATDLLSDKIKKAVNAILDQKDIPSGIRIKGIKNFPRIPGVPGLILDDDLKFLLNHKELFYKTPLWYYVLREAQIKSKGNSLGPCGGRIVAETFFRMLVEDKDSIFHVPNTYSPSLPRLGTKPVGNFDMADLLNFAGVLTLD